LEFEWREVPTSWKPRGHELWIIFVQNSVTLWPNQWTSGKQSASPNSKSWRFMWCPSFALSPPKTVAWVLKEMSYYCLLWILHDLMNLAASLCLLQKLKPGNWKRWTIIACCEFCMILWILQLRSLSPPKTVARELKEMNY